MRTSIGFSWNINKLVFYLISFYVLLSQHSAYGNVAKELGGYIIGCNRWTLLGLLFERVSSGLILRAYISTSSENSIIKHIKFYKNVGRRRRGVSSWWKQALMLMHGDYKRISIRACFVNSHIIWIVAQYCRNLFEKLVIIYCQ